jgi:WD40 repeat protein
MDSKYEAFISYRHKALDIAAARALHRQIETYHIPAYIRRQSGRRKMGKVFRDQDELPLMANLGEGIRAALLASAWLIVVCSPDLPLSKWCMAEIDYFIELGRRDRILTVLIAGEPEESFPPQLRFIETDGEITEVEPLAADIRAWTPGASLRKLRREKLRVLAPMLDVGYDDLRRRQRERSLRGAAWICGAAAAVSLLAGAYVVRQNALLTERNAVIQTQRDTALASESRMLAQNSLTATAEGNIAAAVKLALLALPSDLAAQERPLLPEAENALRSALLYNDYAGYRPVAAFPAGYTAISVGCVVAAPDGRTFAVLADKAVRVYDAETLRLIYEKNGRTSIIDVYAKHPELLGPRNVQFARYNRAGDQLFLASGLPNIIDPHTGRVLREGLLTTPAELEDFGFRRYVLRLEVTGDRRMYDADTGELLFEFRAANTTGKDLVSPDNAYHLMSIHEGVWLRSLPDGEILWTLPGEECIAVQDFTFFSPDARFLLLTDTKTVYTDLPDGTRQDDTTWRMRLMNTASGAVLLTCEIPTSAVAVHVLPNLDIASESEHAALLFAPDSGLLLLPNSEAGYLDAYALPSAEKKYTVAIGGFTSFSPDGRYILSGPLIYDARTGGQLANLSVPDRATTDMRMLGEDTVVTTVRAANGNTACRLWNRSETPFATVIDGDPISPPYPDDSHRLVVSRLDETSQEIALLVTDMRTGDPLFELEKPPDKMAAAPQFLRFFSDNTKIFAFCALIVEGWQVKNALVWDAETGAILRRYRDAFNKDISVISPDGARAGGSYGVGSSALGGAAVWDMRTLDPILEFENQSRSGLHIFDKNITRMLFSHDNIIDVFDMTSGKLLFSLDGYPSGIRTDIYNGFTSDMAPDGDFLAVAHEKTGLIEIFDATGGERLRAMDVAGLKSNTFQLSHNGAKLLFATDQGDVRLYDTASGAEIFSVYDPADTSPRWFSPDDRYIYSINSIRDAATGVKLLTVPDAGLRIRSVWLSPDDAHFIYEYRVDAQTTLTKVNRLPSLEEALATAPQYARDYEFTPEDRLRFALD